MPVNQQPARGQVEEAREQMNERALPGAAGTDDGEHFPGLHFQVDGAQNVAIAVALAPYEKVAPSNTMSFEKAGSGFAPGFSTDVVFAVRESENFRRGPHRLLEAVIE